MRKAGGIGINYEACGKVSYSINFYFLTLLLSVSLTLICFPPPTNLIGMFLSVKREENFLVFRQKPEECSRTTLCPL